MAQIRFLIIQCDGGYFFHLPEIDPYQIINFNGKGAILKKRKLSCFFFFFKTSLIPGIKQNIKLLSYKHKGSAFILIV